MKLDTTYLGLQLRTPLVPSAASCTVLKTTCFARYGVPFAPVALSAFERLLATTLRRCDCAVMAEPAISKTLNKDMAITPVLPQVPF